MIKSVSLMAALAALAFTGAAQAQTAGQSRIGVPDKTEICLDVNGCLLYTSPSPRDS